MYGQSKYGQLPYGVDGVPEEEKEAYYEDLTKLVPEFVASLREMKALYTAEGYQIGYLQHALTDVIDQCFLVTATWGLKRWEQLMGLPTNMMLTYEQRREIIAAKLRGQGTPTMQSIKAAAAAFSGGEVEVLEDNPRSTFIVRFIGVKGIPRNMQGFIDMLEEMKPAHLAYRFEYRYTTWAEMKKYTWGSLGTMTWGDTRTLKEA